MGHPHRLIIRVLNLEPSRHLLGRPLLAEFPSDDLLQGVINRKTTGFWTLCPSTGTLVRIGRTIFDPATIAADFAADRRRRSPELRSDSAHRQTGHQTTRYLLTLLKR